MVTPQQVLEELKMVKDPGFARDIVSFGMVKDIEVGSRGVNVILAPATAREEVPQKIRDEVAATVAQVPGVPAVEVTVVAASPEHPQSLAFRTIAQQVIDAVMTRPPQALPTIH